MIADEKADPNGVVPHFRLQESGAPEKLEGRKNLVSGCLLLHF